ncbi:MAG: energy-coupling factor transporter transmembrane protein EcfT, partial [Muribaculaceae bacterium]|nr:energy-coupling factor transporter transmembrane protein EcfT [Muribaculaceae bacterium]
MTKTEKALTALRAMHSGNGRSPISALALLIITLFYLVLMLSVAPEALARLLWFAFYPIVMAPVAGEEYGRVFCRSLVAFPFVVLIGIFNPLYQTEAVFTIGGVTVTRGWITFISIIVRTLLSVQSLLILVDSVGFTGLCRSLQ